jgi:hypothetical protein
MLGRLIDRSEGAIELLIRLSGWSAIFFVFCIFVFILKEGAPFIFNAAKWETGPTGKTLVLSEIPYENPEEIVIKQMNEAVADGRVSGVERVRLQTEPHVNVVADLKPGADPRAVLEQLAAAVPLRTDYSHMKEFFTSAEWRPDSTRHRRFGIVALLVGSLSVTFLAMLISVPFSLGAAIYISEFCAGKVKEGLKIVVEMLAAIPSVVWGFIGYMIMNPIIIWATGRETRTTTARRLSPSGPAAGRWSTRCCFPPPRTVSSPRCCWVSAGRSARPWRCSW